VSKKFPALTFIPGKLTFSWRPSGHHQSLPPPPLPPQKKKWYPFDAERFKCGNTIIKCISVNLSIMSLSVLTMYQNPFLRKPLAQYKADQITGQGIRTACANFPFLHKECE